VPAAAIQDTVSAIYEAESRRVLATLIRLLGDFDAAEEALHEAFRAALEQWPRDGLPAHPRAWLVSAGRFKAIDAKRRRSRFDALEDAPGGGEVAVVDEHAWADRESVEDDRLRLIFTCCHPALAPDAQVALTLREVCGLRTEEIAHAFLTPAPTQDATDLSENVVLIGVLLSMSPSPIIELNRAVAIAMRDGPEAGLRLVDAILDRGDLTEYRLAHAARADLCRRLGRTADARISYERALKLTRQEPERRFLMRRLADVERKLEEGRA
jgi:predicted RNA polymerase sigma factor